MFRGFGFSISTGVDFEDHGIFGIAVGSLDADKAVIFRTFEVVRIDPRSSEVLPSIAVDPKENGRVIKVWYKEGNTLR